MNTSGHEGHTHCQAIDLQVGSNGYTLLKHFDLSRHLNTFSVKTKGMNSYDVLKYLNKCIILIRDLPPAIQ